MKGEFEGSGGPVRRVTCFNPRPSVMKGEFQIARDLGYTFEKFQSTPLSDEGRIPICAKRWKTMGNLPRLREPSVDGQGVSLQHAVAKREGK